MRTIGFFIAVLLLFPLNHGDRISHIPKETATRIKIPASIASPFDNILPEKTNDIDTSQLKQSGWYADVVKNIEIAEYEIKPAGKNLFASPNRRQNLRASYSADQFIVEPREKDNWKLALQVKGIFAGKNKIFSPQTNAVATIENNTIRFDHNDQFTVEYINSKEGVRQNFIIEKEPESKPTRLSIKLRANKGWYINQVHPKEIHFAKANGNILEKKLTYNDLKVWDANDKELDASFSVSNNEILINVNTNNVIYPITIDPLSTTPNSTPDDADQANAAFGYSVSSAGDVNGDGYSDVIIGAYDYDDAGNTNEGRAFVYHGSITGLSSTPNSTPDDADLANANFGASVAGAGDVNGDGYSDVIIGASSYNDGGNNIEGRVYVYHGSSTGISSSPNTILDDANIANALFGCTLAGAGDINGDGYSDVIIGAGGFNDGPNAQEGRAYVHYGSAAGLSLSPGNVLDDANQAGAYFGLRGVGGAGDVNGDGYSDVIVGADNYDEVSTANEGRAFVYYGSAAGLSSTADWVADDANQVNAFLGTSVTSAGDVNGDGYGDIIIGAEQYDDGGNANEGVAFIYYGSSTGLGATPVTMLDDADQSFAFFGCSVACAGDVNGDGYSDVIVGAKFYTDAGNASEGRAFVYLGSASGLATTPFNTPDDADQASAQLGISVASAGDVNGDGYSDIIVGANFFDDAGNTNEGRAFVYHGGPDGLSTSPAATYNGAAINTYYATSVAAAGDVNGDGYSDVIIGVPRGASNAGAAYLYLGTSTGLSSSSTTLTGPASGSLFGNSVACAGDVNGDGYSDVVVGAYGVSSNQGAAYIFLGSGSGLSPTAATTLNGVSAGDKFGYSVAGAGDINWDGYSDVIVGATGVSSSKGAAYIFPGSGTGLSATATTTLNGISTGDQFGVSVAGAGDINGDGISDVVVGAYLANSTKGGAYVFSGTLAGLNSIPSPTLSGVINGDQFGISVSSAGDINGDGFNDVVVGATGVSSGKGAAFLYLGSNTGLSSTVSTTMNGVSTGDQFGVSVVCVGDINGDGYSDVMIGAEVVSTSTGAAYLYPGSTSGLSSTPTTTLSGLSISCSFGYSVAGAGDVNGDGYSDVIIGAPNLTINTGAAYLYYGNSTKGLRNNLRLYNSDLVTPIQQSNMSDPNLFGAGLYAKSFIGRQKGKLVWQTVKNGNPFTGSPITNSTAFTAQQSSFTDLDLNGTELKNQIAKQNPAKATYIRTRVKYDITTAITGQVYGPWRYPEGFMRGRRDVGAVALPVKFISFTAIKNGSSALLRWITAEEEPGVRFEIQHSTDGTHFSTLAVLNGKNQQQNEYEWHHTNPVKGNNFYRIKALENNKTVFTAIRMLNFDTVISISIYPNPSVTGELLTIDNTGFLQNEQVSISLISLSGQVVFQKEIKAAGNGRVNLSVPGITEGVYLLRLKAANTEYRERIVVTGK